MNDTWQYIGDDVWIFGQSIRGFVRHRRGEVYFSEGRGWIWMTRTNNVQRGIQDNLEMAIHCAEKALGVTG